jgi:hypothetical protein
MWERFTAITFSSLIGRALPTVGPFPLHKVLNTALLRRTGIGESEGYLGGSSGFAGPLKRKGEMKGELICQQ